MPNTVILLGGGGDDGVTLTVAVIETPFKVALTIAVVEAPTVWAVTRKFADVRPCGTVTAEGTVAAAVLELERDMTIPPDPAGPDSMTVPVADCPLLITLGVIAIPLRAGGSIVSPNVSLTPRYAAVRVTGVCAETAPAVTLNEADVAPWGITTLDGKFAAADDELSTTVAPDASAGAVKFTRQLDAFGGTTETGRQVKPFKWGCCWMVTIDPVPTAAKDVAAGSAAVALEN